MRPHHAFLALCFALLNSIAAGNSIAATPVGGAAATDRALLQSKNPSLKLTWLKAQNSLSPFDKIMIAPTEFGYRDVKPLYGPASYTGSRADFPISAEYRERLAKDVSEVFNDELTRDKHYTVTDQPGPGVLVVKTALLDIVSRVPPETTGRTNVYLDTVGDATLLLELVDSSTGETIARAADRRTAEPGLGIGGFGAVRAEPPTVRAEVRRLAQRWGRAIGGRVDELYFAAKPK